MTDVILVALAASFVVSGFEEFVRPMGRWRGLVSLALASPLPFITELSGARTIVSMLATAFITLVVVSFLENNFRVIPESMARRLPRRVPPL